VTQAQRPLVTNASSPRQQLLWTLIGRAGVFEFIGGGMSAEIVREELGRRNFGLRLLAECGQHKELFRQMRQEAEDREEAARREAQAHAVEDAAEEQQEDSTRFGSSATSYRADDRFLCSTTRRHVRALGRSPFVLRVPRFATGHEERNEATEPNPLLPDRRGRGTCRR
jgi:hypothetical protein